MRVTLRIDDRLHAEAKARAARTGRTLSAVIEEAMRYGPSAPDPEE